MVKIRNKEKSKKSSLKRDPNPSSNPTSSPTPEPTSYPTTNPWKAMGLVGVIGVELAVLVLAGIWLGKTVDSIFQTSPVFIIIGIFSGFAVGIWSIVKIVKPFLKD